MLGGDHPRRPAMRPTGETPTTTGQAAAGAATAKHFVAGFFYLNLR
jgi:hypothetical protein